MTSTPGLRLRRDFSACPRQLPCPDSPRLIVRGQSHWTRQGPLIAQPLYSFIKRNDVCYARGRPLQGQLNRPPDQHYHAYLQAVLRAARLPINTVEGI